MDPAPGFRIRKLHVENFGCIKDATVELSPLTVLVGPNDSGKSMLLRTLIALSEASRAGKGWQDVFPEVQHLRSFTFNGRGDSIRIGVEGTIEANQFEYDVTVGAWPTYAAIRNERVRVDDLQIERADMKLRLFVPGGESNWVDARDGVWPITHPNSTWSMTVQGEGDPSTRQLKVEPLSQAVRALAVYSLRPENLRRPTAPETPLFNNGTGLSAALAHLLLNDRDVAERLESALSTAMPHVKRLGVVQQSGAGGVRYELQIITRSGTRIPSEMISDGVLLYLGYLYLVLRPNPASVLLVEEPETGIHVGLLKSVMKLFRDMTTGAHGGPPTQVILTTHSPLLLNLVEPEEIRIVRRDNEGATQISNFSDADNLSELLEYQGPGEIWVNQGEDYLVRKRAAAS
ncbi:MAG: AAA family ATPase [Polyangiaceae bacterium]|nr:AAA family ATPase [Polyangiaceae bacterium]